MNPESESRPVGEEQEEQAFRIIERSAMIRFTGKRMTWGFPWSHLSHYVLKANPDCRDPKIQPPEELTFYFYAAEVTLLGWRLDLMLPDIASQNITRIWTAKNVPAHQPVKSVWITEIFVLPLINAVPANDKSAEPAPVTQQEQP